MHREKEHVLAGQVRKLHTPDQTVSGRNFLVVDWAERVTFDNPEPDLCAAFIARGSRGSSPLNDIGGHFNPLTYWRAVYGYLDGDSKQPFLVDDDEIVDIHRIMHGAYDASANYAEMMARKLAEGAKRMSDGARWNGGNDGLKDHVAVIKEKADLLAELLKPRATLVETTDGVETIARAALVCDELWTATLALSDEIHRQFAQYAPDRMERWGWLKHCDFYCRFGQTEGEQNEPSDRYARGSVLDTLKFFLKESMELRNSLKAFSVNATAAMNWLLKYTGSEATQ